MNPNLLSGVLDPVAAVPNAAKPDPAFDPNPPNPPLPGACVGLSTAVALVPNPLAPKDGAFVSPKLAKPAPTPVLPKGVVGFSGVAVDAEGAARVAGTAKRLLTAGFPPPLLSGFSFSTNRWNSCGSKPFRPTLFLSSAPDGTDMRRGVEGCAGIVNCAIGGELGRTAGGGWSCGEGIARSGGCSSNGAGWGPLVCVKTLR